MDYCDFIERIKPYMLEAKWMREFPGHGRFRGKIKAEIMFYPLNKKVISAFKEYDSFLKVGYNLETELGLDMAFYKGDDLVFIVIRHEDMSYLEPEHEPHFEEIIQKYRIELACHR